MLILKLTIFLSVFGSVALLFSQFILPVFVERYQKLHSKKAEEAEKRLDLMFFQVNKARLLLFYAFSPLLIGGAFFIFSDNLPLTLLGIVIGLLIPNLILKYLEARRKTIFQRQLLDGIMILSSSLKGGLSLLQSLEVLTEEMPAPLSQEFGWVVRENKMGIALDESLQRLNRRMNIEELSLLVNSILVARETGGDLTKVFSRLVTTIRDNRKLKESIKTLTLQGRLQGIIMSALPFVFIAWVVTFNRNHFDIMFQSEQGKILLIAGVILQVVGLFLIRKFSKINI